MTETISAQTTINFKHNYWKLRSEEFTTIRGVTYFDSFDPCDDVIITLGSKKRKKIGIARIRTLEIRPIKELSLEFLKADAEYDGFEINSYQDFLDLMNSFYPRNRFDHAKANMDTRVSIVHWEWLTCDWCGEFPVYEIYGEIGNQLSLCFGCNKERDLN